MILKSTSKEEPLFGLVRSAAVRDGARAKPRVSLDPVDAGPEVLNPAHRTSGSKVSGAVLELRRPVWIAQRATNSNSSQLVRLSRGGLPARENRDLHPAPRGAPRTSVWNSKLRALSRCN